MEKMKILFVCLGNICRSPSAEAIMKSLVQEANKNDFFEIDSAGTSGYNAGKPADPRSKRHALKRNYDLTSISRPIKASDFEYFDLIVAMDDQNIEDLLEMSEGKYAEKIVKITDFFSNYSDSLVPDPYYGDEKDFEYALDLLEDACAGLFQHLQSTQL